MIEVKSSPTNAFTYIHEIYFSHGVDCQSRIFVVHAAGRII